jgi:hypothetical protein
LACTIGIFAIYKAITIVVYAIETVFHAFIGAILILTVCFPITVIINAIRTFFWAIYAIFACGICVVFQGVVFGGIACACP